MMFKASILIVLAIQIVIGSGKRLRRSSSPCSNKTVNLEDFAPGEGHYLDEGYYTEEERYFDNTNCWWEIAAAKGHAILLTSHHFELEDSYGCQYDFVEIFDGRFEAGKSIGKFCGRKNVYFMSQASTIFIQFRTDSSVTAAGFQFDLRQILKDSSSSCNQALRSTSGTITSEGYPNTPYPSNQSCVHSIQSPMGKRVRLVFEEFVLEAGRCWFADSLTVYDGQSSAVEIGRYCGRSAPRSITSSSNSMLLHFETNAFIREKGFKLTYTFVDKPPDAVYEIVMGDPQPEHDPDCSKTLTSSGSILTSPHNRESEFYREMKTCKTVIQAPRYQKVLVHFRSFDLEDSSECIHDHLNVTYRSVEGTLTTIRLCGYHRRYSLCFRSADNKVTLEFRSDMSISRTGYNATYSFISENDTIYCPQEDANIDCVGYLYNDGNGLSCACPTGKVPPDCVSDVSWVGELSPRKTIYENTILSFICKVNHPQATTVWDYDFLVLPDPEKDHIRVDRNGNLTLVGARVTDSGLYTCAVQIGLWMDSKSVNLTVKEEEKLCGHASSKLRNPNSNEASSTILGKASNAVPTEIPYQALLWNSRMRQQHCGGALISERYVLTAAHCIEGKNVEDHPSVFKVRLGLSKCNSSSGEERNISRYLVHPSFNNDTLENDIAILELDKPVWTRSDKIYPICLPASGLWDKIGVGFKGIIAGCGLDDLEQVPEDMRMVSIPMVDREKCRESQKGKTFTDDMFCAGYEGSNVGDTCNGDSGGAFAGMVDGRWTLLGIISFGEGCAQDGQYGFYSNVSKSMSWITEFAGTCGRRWFEEENFLHADILNGEDAFPKQFPWSVAIKIRIRRKRTLTCGGTLIGSRWVLTANHCLCIVRNLKGKCVQRVENNERLKRVRIFAGSVDVRKLNPDGKTLRVKTLYTRASSDAALLELTERVEVNHFIEPACLPLGGTTMTDGADGWVAGWGHTETEDEPSDRLQYAALTKKDSDFCRQHWSDRGQDTRGYVCFLGENLTVEAASGDSGSGLVWEDRGGFTIAGVYSKSISRLEKAGLYGDVTRYVSWILETIGWKS